MGVLYDYFRAPGEAAVRNYLEEHDGNSPLEGFDGIDAKGIDWVVNLGQLIGFATGQEWSPGLVGDRLIWSQPSGADGEDGEDGDGEDEGPWVVVLGDPARDALAGIPAGRVPELAGQWAGIEEFNGHADPADLREVIAEFSALAARAREHGESLYCWCCL